MNIFPTPIRCVADFSPHVLAWIAKRKTEMLCLTWCNSFYVLIQNVDARRAWTGGDSLPALQYFIRSALFRPCKASSQPGWAGCSSFSISALSNWKHINGSFKIRLFNLLLCHSFPPAFYLFFHWGFSAWDSPINLDQARRSVAMPLMHVAHCRGGWRLCCFH